MLVSVSKSQMDGDVIQARRPSKRLRGVPQSMTVERTRSGSSGSGIAGGRWVHNRVQSVRIRLMISLGWDQDLFPKT